MLPDRFVSNTLKPISKDIQGSDKNHEQYESVQRLIKNPTLASGLTSGAKSINRTVDTLMETVFYSIMDQTFSTSFTPHSNVDTNFSRNVNETTIGSYIVVDEFRLGPSYQKVLNKIGNIPITLGTDGNVFVSNIYHRTNAIRAYERETLPFWRLALNNWFGILPILSNILPPSFNQEELYDPLSYLSTPFLAPYTVKQAKRIPIGTIRKYGISGGVNLSFDPFEKSISQAKETLNLEDLDLILPVSVFKTGTHSISTLRKSEHIYWLLVSETRSNGKKVESLLSTSLKVFSKLIPQWGGVKAPIKPIDVLFSNAKISSFDQLYTFDFRFASARNAYRHAAKGNLVPAYRSAIKNQKRPMGVTFEFNKTSYAQQNGTRTERNFFVQQTKHVNEITSSEIEIKDNKGITNILETEQIWDTLDWDVLVGVETLKVNNRIEIMVKKNRNHSRRNPSYRFDQNSKSPMNIFSTLSIEDRFTDAQEFQKMLELLRYYLALPLSNVPNIPVYAADNMIDEKLRSTLRNPMDDIKHIRPTPTHLGKTSINAHISFPSSYLKKMAMKKSFQIRRSMALAYNLDASHWSQKNLRKKWSWLLQYIGWATLQPLKLINARSPNIDFINETKRTVDAFKEINRATTPLEYQESFEKLFDSAYPIQLIRALSLLGSYTSLPRYISFSTSPKHKALDSKDTRKAKGIFGSLNHKIIQSDTRFPKSFAFRKIDRKLSSFNPNNFIDDRKKPVLKKIKITPFNNGKATLFRIDLSLQLSDPKAKSIYLYFKLEQSGTVNFGRLVLFEKTVKFGLTKPNNRKPDFATVSFFTNGANSPFATAISDLVIGLGGDFNLHFSASEDSQAWSSSRFLQATLSDELLKFN